MVTATPIERLAPQPIALTPVPPPDRASARLPAPLTSLVGRERERAAVHALLRRNDVRLVTLTGPGGVGKTRLALRVAEEAAAGFPDGVAFVALAAVRDPALVVPAIAHALGVRETAESPLDAGLGAALRGRRLLLVLDNLEQVLGAAAAIAGLLTNSPGLTVLATSRAPLRLSGERNVAVPSLPLPAPEAGPGHEAVTGNDAVRLFVERAQAVRDDFVLSEANAAAVAEICRRLDGLPLAIELAATRVRLLSPSALLARLGRRLDLLAGGPRDAPQRLRTLRDAIGWSYDLLPDDERALFRTLAVFEGGFDLEDAEAVCDPNGALGVPVLDSLGVLVEENLVRREAGPVVSERDGGGSRFGMLETILEFGRELLAASGEEAAIRRRHADAFLDLAERLEAEIHGPAMSRCLDRMEIEYPNLRAALAFFAASGDAERELRLAAMLSEYWGYRGHAPEGVALLAAALDRGPDAPPGPRAKALAELAWLCNSVGEHERGLAASAAAIPLARLAGDRHRLGQALFIRAVIVGQVDDRWSEVISLLEETVALARSHDLPSQLLGCALGDLGAALVHQGERERGIAMIEEAAALHRALGLHFGAGIQLAKLGHFDALAGMAARAAVRYGESLRLMWSDGVALHVTFPIAGLCGVAADLGRTEQVARVLGTLASVQERTGAAVPSEWAAEVAHAERVARAALGADGFAAAIAEGRGLAIPEAVAAAIAVADDLAQSPEPDAAPTVPLPSSRFSLTEREVEVLGLLAAGNTNPEIAEALFVARGTVRTHVSNILGKLGAKTRTEAADIARRSNLL